MLSVHRQIHLNEHEHEFCKQDLSFSRTFAVNGTALV